MIETGTPPGSDVLSFLALLECYTADFNILN